MKIVLISCVSKKKTYKTKAKDLYDSTWFTYAYKYAVQLKPDKIFILSAKYGVITPDTEIEPYNVTLLHMNKQERCEWGNKVLNSLKQECNLETDEFIILAGEKYREQITHYLKNYTVPMEHLGIGEQVSFLKNKITEQKNNLNLFG